ncbi:hypothetical protein PUMCH_001895 [Australozyma saopauloensis]|uniref:WD repeat protein mio zinc-ribbon like domain-containing protein n=1 Tax=Australozyma saopauloensis TaxID=291208 RepID=A0AAX4H873_9ASCO|nr:hypothetical protein PUMCH_001895 [[Candida] saopauloensis]
MSGSIVRAINWDLGYEQRFLAINPLRDEVSLYQTHHENPPVESNSISKTHSYKNIEQIQCLSYLRPHVGWTGVGTMDGIVHVFDVTKPASPTLRLRTKHNRPCNSLSFNDGSLVAASFDKSRQDNSLQIWDLVKHTSIFSTSTEVNESVVARPSHGYLSNEATLSTVFNLGDPSGTLLMAGSYKLLREFDLRDSSPTPIYQVATKCTLRITLDPLQPHIFSSVGDDGTLSIWDRRKLLDTARGPVASELPVLQFNKLLNDGLRRGNSLCFRFSTIRRGEFSAIFNGNLIRRWNTGCVPIAKDLSPPTFTDSLSVLSGLKQQSAQLYDPHEELFFVAMVLDCKTDLPNVTSFDYSPDTSSHTSTNFVCMREKGLVFRMPVVESVEAIDFNSYNEFSTAGPEGSYTKFAEDQSLTTDNVKQSAPIQGAHLQSHEARGVDSEEVTSTLGDEESTGPINHSNTHLPNDSFSEHEKNIKKFHEESNSYYPLRSTVGLTDVMRTDICYVMRQRALCGYSVDCEANFRILEQTQGPGASLSLQNTWRWISLAKKSLEKGTMLCKGVDLGYVGVLAMWKGVEELAGQDRAFITDDKEQIKPTGSSVTKQMFSNAVRSMIANKEKKSAGISVFKSSEHKLQRKLSLIVSGWYLTEDEFDSKLNDLVSMGQIEKAAGWAVFHANVPRAIEILSQAKNERLRLMSTAIAGYEAFKGSTTNLPWNDLCRKLSLELENPYLRAIFAFISDNDWWDVLDEHALPLRERLGIAARFLADKDLNVYLNRIAVNVVNRGELEGLILTGITPRGIDLLQSYVDKTSDVQTAALIAQYAVPRYFKDERVNHWVDCYRNLLNSWGLFKTRAKFDVARTRSSKTYAGMTVVKPTPRQVFLQCGRCKKNMALPAKGKGPTNNSILMQKFNARNNPKVVHRDMNSCPHCGVALPRCAICLLSLGAPMADYDIGLSSMASTTQIESFKNKFSFCLSCGHGYHAHHAEEWFSKHYVCPVPDCVCRCNSKCGG